MSTRESEGSVEFEHRARAVLEGSLVRVNARARSRLNRARHAAVEEAAVRRRSLRFLPARGSRLLPVTGSALAAAVLALAFVLFGVSSHRVTPPSEGAQPQLEVLDMLSDEDGVSLAEDYDHSFYEWAAAQGDAATDSKTGDGTTG
ncbi:MAG TPA: hypothetical protein VMU67_15690 [Steroidobacteraceae bacterium]|nr:hypothetical protein [Steroidobacteraceae bacterium]